MIGESTGDLIDDWLAGRYSLGLDQWIEQIKEQKLITIADYTVHVKWMPESIRPQNAMDVARLKAVTNS
jgi:phage gp36-like protein